MKKMILIALCLCAIFTSMYMIAEHLGYTDEAYARQQLEALQQMEHGNLIVAGVIIGLLFIDILLPVPSSFVMAFSGFAFGLWTGALVAFTGSMFAALSGFYLCRWGGHATFEKLVGKDDMQAVDAWFDEWGVAAIILSRPIPMLTEILSCLAGLTDMRARTFILASAAGHFPICLIYAYSGSTSSFDNPWPAVFTALLLPAVGWIVTVKIKKRSVAKPEELAK
ncbi:MAG: VTT domain-containing protein [Planctomycetes bacterium]|nr:VTT domain-containing protein [Planctomycetota bacterium]